MAQKRRIKRRKRGAAAKLRTENLRRAQADLKRLRALGANEPAIRKVMLLMGFGYLSPDEFLAVSDAEDLERLVIKARSN